MSRDTNSPALRMVLSVLAAVVFVVFGVSFGAAGASADPTFSIGGTITDSSNTGVGGLNLVLTNSTNTAVDATTNPDGTYSFPGLADDTYTLATSLTGYVPTSSTVTISDADVLLNLTVSRYATITGVITGAGAAGGIAVQAVDAVSGNQYASDAPTDASGAFSITLPPTTSGYAFHFTSGTGALLAIAGFDLGSGPVALSDPCALMPSALGPLDLDGGTPIALTITLSSDPTICNVAATPPPPTQAPQPPHTNSSVVRSALAVTGSPAPAAMATPSAASPLPPSSMAATTFSATKSTRPLLATVSGTAPMPWWVWSLVIVAVLLMMGGVGFTVVRHR